jgi:aspartate carbamoyltransferase catalytic subunit
VVVARHPQAGGAQRVAQVSPVPIINAGDGEGGQHPTQALLDLYTIYRERPLTGLSVAIIGELDRGRTARSLAYLLAKFDPLRKSAEGLLCEETHDRVIAPQRP